MDFDAQMIELNSHSRCQEFPAIDLLLLFIGVVLQNQVSLLAGQRRGSGLGIRPNDFYRALSWITVRGDDHLPGSRVELAG